MARELKIGDIIQRWEVLGTKLTGEYIVVSETKTQVKTNLGLRFMKKPSIWNEDMYNRVGGSRFEIYKLKQEG